MSRGRPPRPPRVLDAVVGRLARLGVAGRRTYLLTVSGRRTGRRYSIPVTLVEDAGGRFLVAPYGERQWVLNARAAGAVELTRARRSERVAVEELPPAEAAPVLERYLRAVPVTRPFFDVRPGAPLEEWVAEAPRHPVFRIRPL